MSSDHSDGVADARGELAPAVAAVTTRAVVSRALRFVVMLLLVAYVLHRAQLTTRHGWADLLETLRGSSLGLLAVSVAFTPLLHIQSTVKWHALTRARHMNVPLRRLYYFFLVGRFYNLVLPSNIGGDLIRIHMLGRASGRYADAAATVFVERLTGVITLVVYACVAIVIAAVDLRLAWLPYAVALTGAGLAAVCWAILDDRPVRVLMRLFGARAPLLDKLLTKLAVLRRSIAVFRDMPSALAIAFGNSVIFYLLAVANIWLSVSVFETTRFSTMLIAVPILMFLMNIPLSVGNVGIMEFAYTFVLGAFGVSPHAALATALLMRLKAILAAAGGGVAHALSRDVIPAPEAVQVELRERAS